MTIPQATLSPRGPSDSAHTPSVAALHPFIEAELREIQRTLAGEGSLPSRARLQNYYDTFRRRFGPEVLRGLDGQELLERMHAHGNRESLVYWLEFKDDDEFPAIFGSIAGGSALKFGVYRRSETGAWAAKGSGSAPQDIATEEAVEIARRHRDQLLAAADLVAAMPRGAGDTDYLTLQAALQEAAPDVQDTAWGHKYLSLLFPEVIDDFHVEAWQRYHLVRLLQTPPQDARGFAEGRYVCAGRFVALAQELDVALQSASTLINRRHGRPRGYWRIGTTDDDRARRKFWPMMRDGGVIAVGWPDLGNLGEHTANRESREAIASLLQRHYPGSPQAVGRAASQVQKFVAGMQEGDRVLAADGVAILGVAEVTGPYRFVTGTDFPHQRAVAWRSLVEWRSVDAEGLRTTVGVIRDYRNQVETERHILEDGESTRVLLAARSAEAPRRSDTPAVPLSRGQEPVPRLTGTSGHVQAVLDRKGQVILYGPPGTGKTYWALRTARDLAALRAFGDSYEALDAERRKRVVEGTVAEPALVRTCSFHPDYGYEDFIEGYRPQAGAGGHLAFALVPGIFRRLCDDAEKAPALDFFLIVDEINRGDVPRIFGELLTLLERDKRAHPVHLPVSGDVFRVPVNVFVLGTMNTADRSIALLDAALRRRFGFVELMPDYRILASAVTGGLPLGAWLADLNARVRAVGGGDARNRQVGHAFFLDHGGPITTPEQLVAVLRDDVVPLLEEYCYDDFTQLAELLGPTLVDIKGQLVRRELFELGREAELVAALMRPEIATAAAAVLAALDEPDEARVEVSEGADDTEGPSDASEGAVSSGADALP